MASKLVEELYREEEKEQDKLILQVFHWLQESREKSQENIQYISEKSIRSICLRYRLRFLDLNLFKGEIPGEAIKEMKDAQSRFGMDSSAFKVIAPCDLFKLENREKDPILIAEVEKDRFVVLHKWGSEFSAIRKLQALPLRNIPSMAIFLGLVALIFSALLVPLAGDNELNWKEFLFGFTVVWMGFISYGLFMALSQNILPSSLTWNSRFLD